MKKNVASQSIGAQLVSATDGSAFTGSVSVAVTIDNGTQASGGGTAPAHEGNGYHSYTPTQAETNGDHVAFTFTGSGAVPVTVQVYTQFPQTGDSFARLGAPAGASIAADLVAIDNFVDGLETTIGTAGAGLTDLGGMSTAMKAEVNAEADTALADYDGPTNAEMEARTLVAGNYGTAANQATILGHIDTEIAAILLDTGTTLDGKINAIKAITDNLPDSGALTQVQADLDDIQSRLPDALVGGNLKADALAISGSTTAADNLEAHALESLPVTFTGGTTTTAVLGNVDGAAASSTDDVYIGRILIFNVGTLNHQVAEITDYVGSTKTATISAVTTAVTSSHTARME